MMNFIERLKQRKSFKLFFISLLSYFIKLILQWPDIYYSLPDTVLFIFEILQIILIILLIYYGILLLAWIKRKLTWKIRNRLIISQIFISVVPLLLIISLALAGFLLITYQVASFQINNYFAIRADEFNNSFNYIIKSTDLNQEQPASMESLSKLVKEYESLKNPFIPMILFAKQPQNNSKNIYLILRDRTVLIQDNIPLEKLKTSTDTIYSRFLTSILKPYINLEKYAVGLPDVYFFANQHLGDIDLYAFAPLTVQHLKGITSTLGYSLSKDYYAGSSVITPKELKIDLKENEKIEVPTTEHDEFPVLILLKTFDVSEANPMHAVVINFDYSSTASNIFYGKSYVGVIGTNLIRALLAIAIIYIFVEIIALIIGIKMTSRITKAVDALHVGTNKVQSGDLYAKIELKNDDQLGELGDSFNSMAASIRELLDEKAKKEAMEHELEVAHDVQKHLFPQQVISFKGLEIANQFLSARVVSGDYYDFFPFKEQLALVIGDVSGKGISAGLIMANTQAILRSFYLQSLINGNSFKLPELVKTINTHIINYTSANRFLTMHFSVIDVARSELTYCNAGHPSPIIIKADNTVKKLQTTGTVLGVFENGAFPIHTTTLAPGDLLFYFTDGLLEACAENYEEYGEERFIEYVKNKKDIPLKDLVPALLEVIRKFSQPDVRDDIALIAIRIKGSNL